MFDFGLFFQIQNVVSAFMNPKELLVSLVIYCVIKTIEVAV